MELAAGEQLRFGGLGLMLDEPGWVLRFGAGADLASSNSADASDIEARIEVVRQRLREHFQKPFEIKVSVQRQLPLHSGLGAGTQLAAAAALGFVLAEANADVVQSVQRPTIDDLVSWTGRGKRSGIGLFGFLNGGLILDEGHRATNSVDGTNPRAVCATSMMLPADWRIVLITPDQMPSVTGSYEASLIERLGETPNPNRERMFAAAREIISLAGAPDSFDDFTAVLQDYVDAAGRMFMAGQGGLYNGDAVARAVELAKQAGLRAVGQSSWGPTVFGFASDVASAQQMAAEISETRPSARWQVRVCSAARQGVTWRSITT